MAWNCLNGIPLKQFKGGSSNQNEGDNKGTSSELIPLIRKGSTRSVVRGPDQSVYPCFEPNRKTVWGSLGLFSVLPLKYINLKYFRIFQARVWETLCGQRKYLPSANRRSAWVVILLPGQWNYRVNVKVGTRERNYVHRRLGEGGANSVMEPISLFTLGPLLIFYSE